LRQSHSVILSGDCHIQQQRHSVNYANQHRHSPGGGTTLQTTFFPVSFGKSFRSAVPEKGCLIFFADEEKTKKKQKKHL